MAGPPAHPAPARPTRIDVDLDAVAHNVSALRARVAPSALWAVVKADGYGHGAVEVGRAALRAGADGLAVALVEEAEALRAAGIEGRLVLLTEPPPGSAARVVAAGVEPAVYSTSVLDELDAAATVAGRTVPVHLKIDSGMHRVGVAPEAALGLARTIERSSGVALASAWTHLAVADEPSDPFTSEQLDRFHATVDRMKENGMIPPVLHAANSAGAIAHPATRLDLVRVGIATYGVAPCPDLAGVVDLRPALRLTSRVSHVQGVPAGEAISYGQRYRLEHHSTIAVVPIGYADGLRRGLAAAGGEVLIGGRRRPIAGTVTMDQITVDCGPEALVARGEEVVLIGRQGDEEITAAEWADRLGTIAYEVTCGLGARIPRFHHGSVA